MSEVTNEIPVKFTQCALDELARLQREQPEDKPFVRVGVKGGGCSGLSYVLEYDKKQDGDVLYELENGISMLMQKAHEMYLLNVEIDFQGGLNSRGFTFSNPNASDTCGCGTSFAV